MTDKSKSNYELLNELGELITIRVKIAEDLARYSEIDDLLRLKDITNQLKSRMRIKGE
jgi:hypothetical protein